MPDNMICQSCGGKLSQEFKFCPQCGKPFVNDSSEKSSRDNEKENNVTSIPPTTKQVQHEGTIFQSANVKSKQLCTVFKEDELYTFEESRDFFHVKVMGGSDDGIEGWAQKLIFSEKKIVNDKTKYSATSNTQSAQTNVVIAALCEGALYREPFINSPKICNIMASEELEIIKEENGFYLSKIISEKNLLGYVMKEVIEPPTEIEQAERNEAGDNNDNLVKKETQSVNQETRINKIPNNYFHNPSEKTLGILGQSYIDSVIFTGDFSKAIMILTDRRVYVSGKSFQKIGNKLVSIATKQAVNIEDVTGTSIWEVNNTGTLVGSIILIILGIVLAILLATLNGDVTMGLFGLYFVVLGFILLIIYFARQRRCFFVEYAGGSLGADCKFFDWQEIEEFQKKISLIKDKGYNNKPKNKSKQINRVDNAKNKHTLENKSKETNNAQQAKCSFCGGLNDLHAYFCQFCGSSIDVDKE
jgi:hypothetical protein